MEEKIMNNNINRRNIDKMQIFDERYKVNQRREINEQNRQKNENFNNRMYNLKQKLIKENSVSEKVNILNQKINNNDTIYKTTKYNSFKENFK